MRKPSQKTKRKKLMTKAWNLTSEYVRRSNADFAGYVKCVTCGMCFIWNSGMIHAGHWIHDKIDFEPHNVHPQCRNCNYKYNKNTNTNYAIFMSRTYGTDEMERLKKLSIDKGNAYSIEELEQIIENLKIKIANL